MRILEILILVMITVLPLVITRVSGLNKKILIISILVVTLLQIILEGYRWQMIPAYFILLISMLLLCFGKVFFRGSLFKKIVVGLFLFLSLSLAWVLPYIFPVFTLPEPTGVYEVGAQDIYLKTDLDEIITEDPSDTRELMIKAWFPAAPEEESRESYLNQADRQGFALKYGLPITSFNYLDLIETHTFKDAQVAPGEFPVLIFSHGQYSNATGYSAIIEDIVSHGYIVLVINHTYESMGSLFPDGRIAYFNAEYDSQKLNQEMTDLAWTSSQDFLKATTKVEKRAIAERLVLNYYASEITQRWAMDVKVVINELEVWNAKSFLSNHIDLNNIGVFGHSQGGAAIGQAMVNSIKIKAGFNIDGVQWGTVINDTIRQPLVLLSSDWPDNHPKINTQVYREDNIANFTSFLLQNSGHASFMDIPYIINISKLSESGSIDKSLASRITSETVVRFFNEHLKDQETFDVDKLTAKYSELIVED